MKSNIGLITLFAIVFMLLSCEKIAFSEASVSEVLVSADNNDTCYVWRGHIVVGEYQSESGKTERILLSLYEWGNMPSANHAEDSAQVRILTEGYQELELGEWRVPTQDEAKYLRENFGEESVSWERLNGVFLNNEASVLCKDARYLCSEGHKSFSFASGTKISNAGSKVRNYRLRLVKCVSE